MFSTRICSRSALVVGASSSTHVVRTRARFSLSSRLLAGGSACLLASLVLSATAQAAPIIVNLRVEGSAKTLFEGPVSTEGETFETPSSKVTHPCNYSGNGNFEGFTIGGTPTGTPTTALRDAALSAGLVFDAKWSTSFGDFFVTQVGTDVNQTEEPFASWGYAVNYTTAPVGGCQVALAPGSEVLWAYNYFNLTHLLRLSGSSSVDVGAPLTVRVVDAQNGTPISGASIGEDLAGVTTPIPGSATTDANGNATIMLSHAGTLTLKATRPDSVRSDGLLVCVHKGNDGTCGTTIPGVPKVEPPVVQVAPIDVPSVGGVVNGRRYRRHHAPRILRGLVQVPAGGTLRDVRISLQRRNGRRCLTFSGAKEAFVRSRCGVARFFSVGGAESFSYLLPASLPRGRYVYDIEAIDASGHRTKLVPGVSHVVFYVK